MRDIIIGHIEAHAMNRPRSLQAEVGPSDIAGTCDHCLAAKLAGMTRRPDPAWLAYIGTAVHAQLEQALSGVEGFRTEQEVQVGTVNGNPVIGHCDLWHPEQQLVVDYKVVGTTTMRNVRAGRIPDNYVCQVNLYALGLHASRVAILFLPRNEPTLARAVWWEQEASPALAVDTIRRANNIADMLRFEVPISGMPRDPGCYDCARYDDQAPVTGTLESLIGG